MTKSNSRVKNPKKTLKAQKRLSAIEHNFKIKALTKNIRKYMEGFAEKYDSLLPTKPKH